jgi:hypothetical protein
MERKLPHNIELLDQLDAFKEWLDNSMNGFEWNPIIEDYDGMFECESPYCDLLQAFVAYLEASQPRQRRLPRSKSFDWTQIDSQGVKG